MISTLGTHTDNPPLWHKPLGGLTTPICPVCGGFGLQTTFVPGSPPIWFCDCEKRSEVRNG